MSDLSPLAKNFPVHDLAQDLLAESLADESPGKLENGLALCLSGGGYRAMLFHTGAVIRLNELGILSQLKRVASVSGGSITAGVLGMNWTSFAWDNGRIDQDSLQDKLIAPIQKMAETSIDVSSVVWGVLSPWSTVNDKVREAYDDVLFHGKSLQVFPDDIEKKEGPRFIINATNVKTGSLWRFSRPYMADYRVGIVDSPEVSIATAVAASSAFPPFLSPMHMPLDNFVFRPNVPKNKSEESLRSLRGDAILTDGGVYDNLGLEAVWKRYKTVLVSDGGRKMDDDLAPASDWARHSRRLIDLLQHQVSNLRRRMTISAFQDKAEPHEGTYWGIQTDIADYNLSNALPCPHAATLKIARIDTRLTALSIDDQRRIINWGYAVCDAGVRAHLNDYKNAAAPASFPYPNIGVDP